VQAWRNSFQKGAITDSTDPRAVLPGLKKVEVVLPGYDPIIILLFLSLHIIIIPIIHTITQHQLLLYNYILYIYSISIDASHHSQHHGTRNKQRLPLDHIQHRYDALILMSLSCYVISAVLYQ
jgi:hypothetical protein